MIERQLTLLLDSAARFPLRQVRTTPLPSPPVHFKGAPILSSPLLSSPLLSAFLFNSFSYGESGITADASLLRATAFRLGVLAALRSVQTRSAVGEVSVNGVQIFEPSGGMLTEKLAKFAAKLANAYDIPEFFHPLDYFVVMENIRLEGAPPGSVLLGRDDRPSGPSLLEAAKQGITSFMDTTAFDVGIVTTTQLQGMLHDRNQGH